MGVCHDKMWHGMTGQDMTQPNIVLQVSIVRVLWLRHKMQTLEEREYHFNVGFTWHALHYLE